MVRNSPNWLDVVKHRIRLVRAPFVLILQHHAIGGERRLAAPVSLPLAGEVDILAPRLVIEGVEYRARVLDLRAIPLTHLGETVACMEADRDAIMAAIDIILYGYLVGIPRQAPRVLE